MNGVVSGGSNKGKGGISSSLPGTALPPGQGLGPESADPLSPLNHPIAQLGRVVLSITQ